MIMITTTTMIIDIWAWFFNFYIGLVFDDDNLVRSQVRVNDIKPLRPFGTFIIEFFILLLTTAYTVTAAKFQ